MEKIVRGLKEIVDRKGPEYLLEHPYKVFENMIEKHEDDRNILAAILYVLASGMLQSNIFRSDDEDLSETIQKKCCLNKDMADCLAGIFSSLYSPENIREWKEKENVGLREFLKSEFSVKWQGFAIWWYSTGSISCHYNGEITLAADDIEMIKEAAAPLVNENPFVTKEEICRYYEEKLVNWLDVEFEDYCTCEEYYEPVVEDFFLDDYVKEWCRKNGLRMVSCEGSGYDDGYEPDY